MAEIAARGMIELLDPSAPTISHARLTLAGIAIPEPTTLVLAVVALAGGIVAVRLRPW